MVKIIAVEGIQSFRHQVFGQTLRPCSGTGEQNDLVSVLFVARQIFYQQFKAVIVGIDGFQVKMNPLPDVQLAVLQVERRE